MNPGRLIVKARNTDFPLVSDGHKVRSQDTTILECSTAPAVPPDCVSSGGRRAPFHLASLTDDELVSHVRTQLDLVTSELERELAQRLADALDENARLEGVVESLKDDMSLMGEARENEIETSR